MDRRFRKNLASYDLDTGEILYGVPVYFNPRIKWREEWFMGIQEAFIELAKDKEIRGRTRSVLDYMFGKLGWENYICIQQKEICEALNMNKSNVSSSIKLLLSKGIILTGPKLGRTTSYILNSKYGWRGKIKNLIEEKHLRLVRKKDEEKPIITTT